MFPEIGKLYEIQNSVSINKVLLEYSHAHGWCLLLSGAAFMMQQQS